MNTFKITTIGWWGAYPSAGEATSGYLLQTEGRNILVDCGSGVLSQLQNYIQLQHLDTVVLSHYHWDHVADIGCLQYAARILMDLGERKKPLEIYGHAEDSNFSGLNYLQYCRGCAIEPSKAIDIGGLRLTFCRNIHPDPCFSIRFEHAGRCLAYIADTAWTDDLVKIARNADLLLCESSLYDEYLGRIPGHLTSGEAGSIAARAGVKHLVLTHLPHFGNHERLLDQAGKKFAGRIELAATGKAWQF